MFQKKFSIAVFLFCFAHAFSFAQVKLDVKYSSRNLSLGEVLTLQIKADGADRSAKLIFPKTGAASFQLNGPPSVSSQTIIVNGKVQSFSGLIYSVAVVPAKEGSLNLPPIQLEWKGQVFKTENIVFRVLKAGSKKMHLLVETGRNEVYTKEAVDLTLSWLIDDDVSDYSFNFPLFDDPSVHADLINPTSSKLTSIQLNNKYKVQFYQDNEEYKGQFFTSFKARFRVYIDKVGRFQIPNAVVKAQVKSGTQIKRDIFGFRRREATYKVLSATSNAKIISLKPLPEKNMPASFSGAVGTSFSIKSDSSYKKARVGDPIKLNYSIKGDGNLNFIKRTPLNLDGSFTNFSIPQNSKDGVLENNELRFQETIRAKKSTVSQIPAISFYYFNPKKRKYEVSRSLPIPIEIKEAKELGSQEIVAYQKDVSSNDGSIENRVETNSEGLRSNYIFTEAPQDQAAPSSFLFLIVLFSPSVFGFLVTNRERFSLLLNALGGSAKNEKPKKFLEDAKRLLNENEKEFLKALYSSLESKFSTAFEEKGQLTEEMISSLREQKSLEPDQAEDVLDFLRLYEAALYSQNPLKVDEKEKYFEKIQRVVENV